MLHGRIQPFPRHAGDGPQVSERKFSNVKLYRRLYALAQPYSPHLIAVLLLSLSSTPLSLLMPVPLKIAVDSVIGSHPLPQWLVSIVPASFTSGPTNTLLLVAGLLVGVTLLVYVQALGSWLLQTYTGEKLVLDFRAQLFRHVQRLSLSYHDAKGTTDSTYRIQYDAVALQHITINGGVPLITAAATLAGMVLVTAWIDWQLAVIAMTICPVLFFVTGYFGRRLRSRWYEVKELDSSAMSVVQEVLSAVRVVKAFGREDHEQNRFLTQSNERLRGQIDLAYIEGRFELVVGVTLAAGTAAVLFVGVQHTRAGILTIGQLLMVMSYLSQIYEPLKTISKKLTDLQSGLASLERGFLLLDELPEVAEKPHAAHLAKAAGAISFRNVDFAYEDGHPVLNQVSYDVQPGMRVGIQGPTGSGKTTLISLLMRFYDVTSGEIILDGRDLRDYRLADLRNQYAMVLQEPVLFSSSVLENIAYGKPGASTEEIVQAARLANAHDFIQSLPDRYQTLVGERGMRLSGGERQRISIARAFLKDAPILILDEPTSSVDTKTETAIIDAMERLMRNRTTFMIAHRLSTLQRCDLMLTLEHGRIAVEHRPEAGLLAPS